MLAPSMLRRDHTRALRRIALAALLPCAAAIAAPARACDAVVVERPSTLRLDYDPFAVGRALGRMSFTVQNRDAQACTVEIALLGADRIAVDEADIGGSAVRVRFNGGMGDAQLNPTATPGIWRAQLDPGKTYRLAIEAVVIRDAIAEAGEYADTLTMEVRDEGAVSTDHVPSPIRIVLISPPRAQMNIARGRRLWSGRAGQPGGFRRTDD